MNKADVKVVSEDLEAILSECIADYESRTNKQLQPAHIERCILQSYAYRELLVRKGVNEAFLQTFPQFATGIMLDLCGEPMGCYRLENQSARCIIRFSVDGTHNGTIIPKGTVVAANDAILFETEVEVIIDPTVRFVDVLAVCQTAGEQGNEWQVGQIKSIKTMLDGRVSASNVSVSGGGVEVESDEAYRKRILLAPEAFTTCGSVAAYEYHARSVSQYISDVSISTPVGGSVKIVVLSRDGIPTQDLLNQVRDELSGERKRPLCDTVLVESPEVLEFEVAATLTLFKNASAVESRAAALEGLSRYLSARQGVLGKDIVPMDIASALKVDGVYNVTIQSPMLTKVTREQWAKCTDIRIELSGVREDG